MEQLKEVIAEQQTVAEELTRKLNNMKKDPSTRKTEQYLEKKSSEVDTLWQRFLSNNLELEQMDKFEESTYAKTGFFQQTEGIYNKLLDYIQACNGALEKEKMTSRQKEQITTRLVDQARRIELLNADIESALKATDGYNQYLDDIKKQWEKIRESDVELSRNPSESRDSRYFKEEWFRAIRTKYREAIIHLDKKIREQTENGHRTTNNENVLLPKLKIPIFDGKYEDWPTFQDIFTKVIHTKNSISSVEKLQYLKTYVTGDAEKAIQHYEITERNYSSAWRELKERYDNKRRIVNKLINKILNFPTMRYESAIQLKNMYNTVKECLEAIKMQNIDTSSWDPMIVCVIANKWDSRTSELHETTIEDGFQLQKLDNVLKFLMKRFQAIEARENNPKKEKEGAQLKQDESTNGKECKYCKSSHPIYACLEFKALTSAQRYKFIKDKKLCYNCLNHEFGKKCFSHSKCRICERNHHTLIHKDESKSTPISNKSGNNQNIKKHETSVRVNSNIAYQDETVLLATAIIKVETATKGYEYLRALIDPGSQASFITEEAASLLGKTREKVRAEITGLGDTKPKVSNQKIKILFKARISSPYKLGAELLVLPKLTKTTPENEVRFGESDWQNVILADPNFYKPGPVDIILGAREYKEVLQEGIKKTKDGLLGQNTELGWIIFGACPASSKNKIEVISMMTRAQEEDMTTFWEIEDIVTEKNLTKEEEQCEKFYDETTTRGTDGKYTVRIPFKADVELGESRSRAMARFLQLEKRLLKQENNNNDYKEFMQAYVDLGHMIAVPNQDERQGKYYIPHQPIIRPESSTTKLRVVFDASCRTSNGKSLNEIMCTGPRKQQELSDILLRWRSTKFAFSADIEKMYRQIKISEEDQDYHRILWRWSSNDQIKEYKLATVTYGTASAPYLAVKTIQKLAKDEMKNFPEAARAVMQNFYVDDVLAGADTEAEAMKLQEDLIRLFNAGGFNLRKWCSNSKKVFENVQPELREKELVELKTEEVKKTLGIHWLPVEDNIMFRVNIVQSEKITKRIILSNVAKVFDPLGLLAPVTVTAKLIIQEMWKANLEWDQNVPKPIADKWKKFCNQIKTLEEITIARWTGQSREMKTVEMHGFCDASEKAIGAVLYLKISDAMENTTTTILMAKSKVAPIKTKMTLPRLELSAAVLLAKIIRRVSEALMKPNWKIYAWSDSMIALAWIQGDVGRWKTFVANRVTEIHQLIGDEVQWRHVGTKENPADLISRGSDPSKLKEETLWWTGPEWLKHPGDKWPKQERIHKTKIEEKQCLHINVNSTVPTDKKIHENISSLTKAKRVVAYCLRFIHNCKREEKAAGPLSAKELEESLRQIIVSDQQTSFEHEIHSLKIQKRLSVQSKLSNLHPFVDKQGILRVGGRLKHSLLKYNEKHPIIVSGKSHLAELIMRDAHQRTLHGGNQQTLAYTRRKYWVINGKKLTKKIINKCTTCIRYRGRAAKQLMGQLPEKRVTPAAAFVNTGVDYAGPILVRTTKGRGHKSYKGYIAIFVCLSTKAVHLEVVSDMTSEAFMAALKRFIARRGPCRNMYSDNGTTFVGASKMLGNEISTVVEKSDVRDQLANIGTQWHFIPPAAPHFGGIWEAGVKSTI